MLGRNTARYLSNCHYLCPPLLSKMEEQNFMSCHGAITLRGAGANNLRIFLLRVPTGRFVVVSGVSGSGKSSLAFATLHAEGMRRYVSSLSVFARQFMRLPARMSHTAATQTFDNPAIAGAAKGILSTDGIETFCQNSRPVVGGMPPSVAIGQHSGGRGGRSTVGTVTEVYDYLRLLFARTGRVFSPVSGMEVRRWSPSDVADYLLSLATGHEEMRLIVLAPICGDKNTPGALRPALSSLMRRGFSRIEAEEEEVRIEDALEGRAPLKEGKPPLLLVDRLSLGPCISDDTRSRLHASVETAFEVALSAWTLFLPLSSK